MLWNAAATYSPTWWGSTIGTGELNCSVRNGKRWDLAVIAAAICLLKEFLLVFCSDTLSESKILCKIITDV